MKFRIIFIAIAAVAVVGASVALVYVWESPIAPVAPSSAGPFEPALVHEGALLAMAIESTIDDLAPASCQDVVAFRLKHLNDPRAVDVVQTAASRFGWASRFEDPAGAGRGFAFARYKNLEGWCAVAVEVAVQPDTGRVHVKRMVAAVDTGQVVNPDGIRNQVEGGMLQALSRNLFERMTFDRTRVTSIDWSAYPVLRFGDVPGSIDVHVIERPGDSFFGVAEATQGPSGAALANSIRDATGLRLREVPFTASKSKSAIGL
jgi:nicotinate dehydrogenase subunit B